MGGPGGGLCSSGVAKLRAAGGDGVFLFTTFVDHFQKRGCHGDVGPVAVTMFVQMPPPDVVPPVGQRRPALPAINRTIAPPLRSYQQT